MTWKTTSHTSSTGDSATFAAEDINKFSRMLNGEDVDDVTIGLDWTFGSGKLNTPDIKNTGTLTLPTSTDTLVGRATTDTLTNKTLTLPVISAVSNSGTVTFPTGSVTLASLTGSETLTNKTLTSPIISTISNSGTLTLPTSTDTLVGRDTTDTLTNKTLDSTNTISSATSLPVVTVAKGGTGAATATLGFDALSPMTTAGDIIIGGASGTRTRLGIGTANQVLRTNSGATAPEWASTLSGLTLTAPVISTISNSGTVTLPTGTVTLATLTGSETLTNKTLTAPIISSISNSGTVTLPTGSVTLATLTGSETLTNKTLTSPIISSISNTGTVTLPTASDTLVGKATTDVLTNKSIDSKTNTFSNMAVHPSVKRTGVYTGAGTGVTTACSGTLQGNGALVNVGTGGSSGQATTGGLKWVFTTGATSGGIGGLRFNANKYMERSLSPLIEAKLQLRNGITTERVFFGFISSAIAPTALADPLASLSGVGFFYDAAVDTEWLITQNDGSVSSDSTTIINVATVDQLAHTYAIKAVASGNKFQYSYDGGAFVDVSTKIPGANTALGFMIYVECTASSARTIDIWWIWNELDG